MPTILFNGPFIPEVDAGYNVQANGVSINFLRDPFCFRNNLISMTDKKCSMHGNKNPCDMKNNLKVLEPITKVNYVEVPKYIYKEKIIHKDEIVYKNVYVPYDGPVYKIKHVNVPVYKEKIRYVPKDVEVEKIYEIPKLDIKDRVEEDLLILHKNNITHKKLNYVVERVIPTLCYGVSETTKEIPSISFIQKPLSESSNFILSNSAGSEANTIHYSTSTRSEENKDNQKKEAFIKNLSEQLNIQKESIQDAGSMINLNKLEEIFESYKHIVPSLDSEDSSKIDKIFDLTSNTFSTSS